MDALLGKDAVHSESSQDQGNLVFGGFQEPLLYATQVFLEENDPKIFNDIIGILKDYITKDRYKKERFNSYIKLYPILGELQ